MHELSFEHKDPRKLEELAREKLSQGGWYVRKAGSRWISQILRHFTGTMLPRMQACPIPT